jgi:hypothetical protein
MNIQQIRQKYPQYSDLSDEQLAKGLHQKFYSDLSFDVFAERIGFAKGAPSEPVLSPEEMLTPVADTPEAAALRQKTREYEAGTSLGERVGRDIKRGVLRGMNVLPSMSAVSRQKEIEKIRRGEAGRTDPMTGEFIPLSPEEQENAINILQQAQMDELESVAKREAQARAIPGRPVTQAIGGAKTFGEAFEALATDPFGAMAGFAAESLPQMAPALAIGAVTRQPIAGAAAMGGTSLTSELGNSVFEYLAENGVDINDTNAVMSALDDPKLFKEAYDFALKRGAIIGAADAATAGLASKALVPKRLVGSPKAREAINIAIAQPAAQVLSGAGGEAAAQLATYGEIRKPGEVVAEAVGEGPTSIAETAAFGGRRIYEELRGGKAAPAEAPEEAPKPAAKAAAPRVEPTMPEEEKAEAPVTPAFAEEELEGVEPVAAPTKVEAPAEAQSRIDALQAEFDRIEAKRQDPLIAPDSPEMQEFDARQSEIRQEIRNLQGAAPKAAPTVAPVTEDLYNRLLKATPAELKKIDIPKAEAPDLLERFTIDDIKNPALEKKLTKIVNSLTPEEYASIRGLAEEPTEQAETEVPEWMKEQVPMKAPPPVEQIMESWGVGKAPAEKFLQAAQKKFDVYTRWKSGENVGDALGKAMEEFNNAYSRISKISRLNKQRAEAAKKPTKEEQAAINRERQAAKRQAAEVEEMKLPVEQQPYMSVSNGLRTIEIDNLNKEYGEVQRESWKKVDEAPADQRNEVYKQYQDRLEDIASRIGEARKRMEALPRPAGGWPKKPPTVPVKVSKVPAKKAVKEEHVEDGESEPITKPVIQEAVSKGARGEKIDYSAMRKEVERQVDEAIAKSPYKDDDEWNATAKSRRDFVTFSIPNDGTFKIKNNKERLAEFKKRLTAAVKPKEGRGPQFAISPASVETTLRDLVDSNDIQSAIEFAALKGVKISESKLDLKQKLKVKEYIEDPDAFEAKVAREAAMTEEQRQRMREAEEKRRIETRDRLVKEQEAKEAATLEEDVAMVMTGSDRDFAAMVKEIDKRQAEKILDKIDELEVDVNEKRIEDLKKKAGTFVDPRVRQFTRKLDSASDTYEANKQLFKKMPTAKGPVAIHTLIEDQVDAGAEIVTSPGGERKFGLPGDYSSEKQLGQFGMDYAGYLLSQKRKAPRAEAKTTEEQKANAQMVADEIGGEVVYQEGDYALIRGYSMMTGDPVYVPAIKTQRARVDIERFTGKQVPDDVKKEMIEFKQKAEADAASKHKSNPFITFDRGLATSNDIDEKLAGVIRGWKDLLKINVPVYVSTIEDAKRNRNNFTGPHRRIGSGTLDEKERGSMRRMADDSYYILFEKSTSPTFMLEVIAHEMGHLHERLVYERATPEQKAALKKAHESWLSRQEGKMAKDLVAALRGRAVGKRAKVPADQTVFQMSSYWKSFGEWYADQVSRWAVTNRAPVNIVEKFFKRLANQLRTFYQKLKNANYLPDRTFVDYLDQVNQEPVNAAPSNQVIDDTPEFMKDVDNEDTRRLDDLLEKHNRPEAPLHPSNSVKDRMLGTYRGTKKIGQRVIDDPLGVGKGVISGADRAITYARNKNIWYGTGVDQADFSRYNGQLRDAQGKAVASIAVTNAIHAGHVGTQVMVQGGLEYNDKTKQFMAVKRSKSMANVLKEKAKLVDQLGAQRAANVIQAYFEAKRSRSIIDEYLAREQRYQDALDSGENPEEAAEALANIERAASKVNMDDEQIDEFIALEKEYPELRAMMDNWTAVNQNQLDMSYFAGNLSKARYEQLKAIKDYVPWYRIMDDQKDPHDFPTGGTTRTMTNVAREKRFKAGEVGLDIDDIVDNMIHNVMWMTKNTMRNYAANRIADEYGIRNEKGKLKVFPKEGADSDGVKFNILRNGRRIVIGVADPLIAEAAIGMENVEIPMNKILSIMANGLRRSITLSGAFQLKQLFMDAPTAAWVSGVKNPFAVWANTFIAFGKVLVDKDPIAQKLRQAGIGGFMSTARTPEQELALEIGLLNKSMYAKVLRVLDHIGDASDYAQRVSIYKQVLKETGDEAQALLQANNVIDFLKRGSGQTAQFLSRTVSFMNAYAVSIDVLATTLAGGGLKGMARQKAITRMAITGGLLSFTTLLYCFAVGDDEEYEKLDDQTKLRNFIIPGSKKYFGETVALPMHTSASFFFKAIPELLYNKITREGAETEMDSRRFRKALKEAFMDSMLGPNVVPTGAKPFIEIGLNKNFWTGSEVIPKGMQDLEAAEQYNAATSELGKVVSALTSIPGTDGKRLLAPIEADHLMRSLFGSAAAMAMWGTNMLAGDRAESRVKDLPVIGAFVLPPVPRGREDLFYDLKEATDQKWKTFNSLLDREKYDEADKYLEKHEGLIGLHDYTSQMDSALKEINKEIRRIGTTSAKDMSPKERREQMNEFGNLKGEILEGIESLRRQAFD